MFTNLLDKSRSRTYPHTRTRAHTYLPTAELELIPKRVS